MTATVRLKQELGDAVELAFSPARGASERKSGQFMLDGKSCRTEMR